MKKIISWFIVCWLPMKLAINLNAPFLSATFGQFMLFKKSSFTQIGGFIAIKDSPVDDFQLGRNIKKNMFKWMLSVIIFIVESFLSKRAFHIIS